MRTLPILSVSSFVLAAVFALFQFGVACPADAQVKKKDNRYATVQGVIENDSRKAFRVSYDEIKTSLRKIVIPKEPPFPSNWEKMKEEERREWLTQFYQSERGKKFLKDREKLLNDAPSFEVKYNDEGDFVVYDVPPGDYGLQGRIDKEIKGIKYGFEVFARIKVLDDVDQIKLQPIPVTITPLFQTGQPAPPLDLVTSKNEKLHFDLDAYKDHYIFLNFMNSTDMTPGYQQQVQDMYKAIGKSHKLKLVSVVIDEDKTKAIKWLLKKKFTEGSYGFTNGWEHDTIEAYGVRSTPSGWLISPDADRKILMSQHEFFRLARIKNSITEIVRDRIDGKDTPTLAAPPEDGKPPEEESADDEPAKDKKANDKSAEEK
ncbi:TlpA family protein disulfide reductase [Mariniblastus fucicola]|uniref:AhpC/TSA family protein n=1 Tax=Mariniblastus fucicola TaxID=980251 RepID=A0A5B9P836_9BACT|nr:redoxin domain-containing protein [Mariniblastus fucicola]QEG21659.1 AhpC/TSA family protein [Mariniblastus fucicola]